MPEVEGKKTTSLKVILSHFLLFATSFFLGTLDPSCPRKNQVSTAALLCTFLRIKNRAKTQDTNFVQKSFNPNARFFILLIFSFLIFFSLFFFFYCFGFFLFLFFLDFPFLPPHEGAYLIGLTIHKLSKAGLIPFSHIGAYLIRLTIHKLSKAGLTPFFSQVPT